MGTFSCHETTRSRFPKKIFRPLQTSQGPYLRIATTFERPKVHFCWATRVFSVFFRRRHFVRGKMPALRIDRKCTSRPSKVHFCSLASGRNRKVGTLGRLGWAKNFSWETRFCCLATTESFSFRPLKTNVTLGIQQK